MGFEFAYSTIIYSAMMLALTLIACYFTYYFTVLVKRPLLACRKGPWRSFLQDKVPLLQESYWPTPWCVDGRIQTVFGALLRYALPDIVYQRQILDLKDGGIVSLDWVSRPNESGQPIVMILPGLTGSSQSEYIKGFVNTLKEIKDYSVVVFNHRGMGDTELKTSRAYCGANSDDFEEAIEHIHSKYPESPILASGISLGGMVIGNYLVTRGEKATRYLSAAMLISVPWNLSVTTESIEKPYLNLLINRTLTVALRKLFQRFRNTLDGEKYPWKYDHLMKSKTIREFDDRFTALNFGFRSVEEYYEAASLHDKLHKIRVPVFCLTSADDPFLPMEGIPVSEASSSSHVAIAITSLGGHVGFLEGIFPVKTVYSDRLYGQFVKGIFSHLQEVKDTQKEGVEYVKSLDNGNYIHMCDSLMA